MYQHLASAPAMTVKKATAAEHLNELFQGIFPSWISVVATLLALLILLLVMTKLFYNPVRKMVAERRKFIQENIDSSIKQNQTAAQDRQQANHELVEARVLAANIIAKAKLRAEKIKEENLARAKDEANNILTSASKDIEREKLLFEKASRKQIVNVALAAAKKIVEKEIDTKDNRKIIDDFIAKK